MKTWNYIFFLLIMILSLVVISIFQIPDDKLHIIACDVGQGDGILMVYKDLQILTDGGPDNRILECLGNHIPFWDREIEMIISTHSDADHLTGIVDVINRYKVDQLLINPIDSGTPLYGLLQNRVGSRGISTINPVVGMKMRLGLIYLDILSPFGESFSKLKANESGGSLDKYIGDKNINLYSIAYKISFRKFTGLMLGDIPPEVSDELSCNSELADVDYIKVPHHGSDNGLTQNLLELSRPKVALISVAKNNEWGFPSEKILKMLANYNIKTLRTDELGDIDVVTNGERMWLKK